MSEQDDKLTALRQQQEQLEAQYEKIGSVYDELTQRANWARHRLQFPQVMNRVLDQFEQERQAARRKNRRATEDLLDEIHQLKKDDEETS